MGLFRKESKTHFERDKEGRVVKITQETPRRRIFERKPLLPKEDKPLTREEQFPKEIQPEYVRQRRVKQLVSTGKKVDAWIGRNIQPIGGYPSKSVKRKSYSIKDNYNPFGSIFDTGMKPMGMPKTTRKKKTTARKKTPFGFDLTDNWGFMK